MSQWDRERVRRCREEEEQARRPRILHSSTGPWPRPHTVHTRLQPPRAARRLVLARVGIPGRCLLLVLKDFSPTLPQARRPYEKGARSHGRLGRRAGPHPQPLHGHAGELGRKCSEVVVVMVVLLCRIRAVSPFSPTSLPPTPHPIPSPCVAVFPPRAIPCSPSNPPSISTTTPTNKETQLQAPGPRRHPPLPLHPRWPQPPRPSPPPRRRENLTSARTHPGLHPPPLRPSPRLDLPPRQTPTPPPLPHGVRMPVYVHRSTASRAGQQEVRLARAPVHHPALWFWSRSSSCSRRAHFLTPFLPKKRKRWW